MNEPLGAGLMICPRCNGTGLVPGKRKAMVDGKWTYIPYKGRERCPDCDGKRETE